MKFINLDFNKKNHICFSGLYKDDEEIYIMLELIKKSTGWNWTFGIGVPILSESYPHFNQIKYQAVSIKKDTFIIVDDKGLLSKEQRKSLNIYLFEFLRYFKQNNSQRLRVMNYLNDEIRPIWNKV